MNGELIHEVSGHINGYFSSIVYVFVNFLQSTCYTVSLTGKVGYGNEIVEIYDPSNLNGGLVGGSGYTLGRVRSVSFKVSIAGKWAIRVMFDIFPATDQAILIENQG